MPLRLPSSRGDLALSPVIFGAMWHRLTDDDEARIRCVHEALDLGISSFDTAPLYDFGGSESLLGKALKGRFGDVQLLTKVGLRWDGDDHGDVLFQAPIDGQLRCVRRDSRPQSIRKDVEASLRRLGTGTLDLVQVHHHDARVPVAESMGELLRLRTEGKLRHIGVSNFPPHALQAAADALGEVPLLSSQEQYNLLERDVEAQVLPRLRQLDAGLLCYSPLAQGLLAGALLGEPRSQWPARGALFTAGNVRLIHAALVDTLQPVAEAHRASLAATALAWLLAEPGVCSVVVGASSGAQLRQNVDAARLVLKDGERAAIRERFAALRLKRAAGESLWRRGRRRLGRLARAALSRARA